MRGRSVLTVVALVGIVVAALVVVLATRAPVGERANRSALIGEIAPDASGTTIEGDQVSIDDFRGRWVVLNFFGSWCTACVEEHPELVAFYRSHQARGDATLLTVTFDDTLEAARRFFAERGGGWPVINDPENSIGVAYGIAKVPESWLIAPNGVIVERFAGKVTARELDSEIARFERGPE